jgi:hypothetical protein
MDDLKQGMNGEVQPVVAGEGGARVPEGADRGREWGKSSPTVSEGRFLGEPRSRTAEFFSACKIFVELIKGFRGLHFVGPCVTVFGSARFKQEHRYYQLAREVGAELARAGFTVMTGGGPGIMEAASRGAKEAGGATVGSNIRLAHEEEPNRWVDHFVEFDYFFVRKLMLFKYSYGFIVAPGGFGTLDEVFETATLIQTGKMAGFPVVLLGTDYWRDLISFVRDTMVPEGTISPSDFDRLVVTDSPREAAVEIAKSARRHPGLRWQPAVRPSGILGERPPAAIRQAQARRGE